MVYYPPSALEEAQELYQAQKQRTEDREARKKPDSKRYIKIKVCRLILWFFLPSSNLLQLHTGMFARVHRCSRMLIICCTIIIWMIIQSAGLCSIGCVTYDCKHILPRRVQYVICYALHSKALFTLDL